MRNLKLGRSNILHSCFMGFLASAALISVSGAEPNRAGQDRSALKQPIPLASITLENGNTLAFYEPAPGRLFVSELGMVPNEPLHKRMAVSERLPVDLFRSVAPGASVPQALIDAQERLLASGAVSPLPPATPGAKMDRAAASQAPAAAGSSTLQTDELCPAEWYRENFCGEGDWQICWTNGTGGSWFTYYGLSYAYTAACSYYGDVVLTAQYYENEYWYTYGSWTVTEGRYQWAYVYNYDQPIGFDSEVSNAQNSEYHHSGYGLYF